MSAMSSMAAFPWLTTIGLIPLVGALVVLACGRAAVGRVVALVFSLVTLVVTVVAATRFDLASPAQFQLAEVHEWIPQFGVSYALGVDGVALAMIVMAAIIVPICLLAAWNDIPEGGARQNTYYAWMLFLETVMVGLFAATDVFLFYVFFEVLIIPVYFLIGSFGGAQRRPAATRFLMFAIVGGFIMLASVIGIYVVGPQGPQGFLVGNLTGLSIDPVTERFLFLGFFIAFAIKAPMWPVHSWLPLAAGEARPATAVLLIGVLDKVGTYGMIRFCLQLFPEASQWATPVVIVLALVSILYGAALAIGEPDLMRLIGYTSISHFGFIILGIFALTHVSSAGAALYMVNHGFSTAALFLIAGMLIARGGSARIADYGGWQRVTPVLAGCFLVAGLSALALPGLGSFVSEFLVMMGTFQRYPVAAVVSSIAIILAALYVLLAYQRIFTGPVPAEGEAGDDIDETVTVVQTGDAGTTPTDDAGTAAHGGVAVATLVDVDERGRRVPLVPDLSGREKWVVAPLIIAFLVLGAYPKPALDVINSSVSHTLQYVGVTDPAPSVGSANGSAK